MKKIISAILVIFSLALVLSACSGGSKSDTLMEAMLSKQDSSIKMVTVKSTDDNAAEVFKSTLDPLSIDNVDSFFIASAESTREYSDEIIVLHLKSAKFADSAMAAVSRHFGYKSGSYSRINPSQVPKLNNKSLFVFNNYVVLIISESSAEIEQAFYNAVK